jgi:hypothetical protein
MFPSTVTTAIGWLGTAFVIASYAQADVRTLRRLSMIASVALIVFNVTLGIWSNVVLEIALVAINVSRLTRRADVPPAVPDLADVIA